MPVPFPFSGIVGQDEMKLALLLAAVDATLGGVLVFGDRGTGKSTAVRALAMLLPPMKAVEHCPYHCDPELERALCSHCQDQLRAGRRLRSRKLPVPVVDLPLGATEDRVVVALALVSVSLVRLGGGPPEPPRAEPLVQRDFQFRDRADGGISVLDADSGELLEVVEPATNGFLRATLRGLARERKRRGVGPAEPFRLTARVDGRLTLEDPATGRRVDLEAFGPANAGAFARLLALNNRPR